MSPIDSIGGGVTQQLLGLALDGAMSRQAAIATNIANAQTPGYQPLAARFDDLVQQLRAVVSDRAHDPDTRQLIGTLSRALDTEPLKAEAGASKVEVDMQMGALAKNNLQYQALIAAQNQLLSIDQLVIGDKGG